MTWRHNGHDGVSNHQPHDCLLNRLFRRRLKKTSKLCVTGLCAGNSPVTGEFPAQSVSNAENISILWCHHVMSDQLQQHKAQASASHFCLFVRGNHRWPIDSSFKWLVMRKVISCHDVTIFQDKDDGRSVCYFVIFWKFHRNVFHKFYSFPMAINNGTII